jgi:hypothetical protein
MKKMRKWLKLALIPVVMVFMFNPDDIGASQSVVHVWHNDLDNGINQIAFPVLGGDDLNGSPDGVTDGKDNNGHGNNIDGVDSSNQGQGKGGPNGTTDLSCQEGGPCVDDEGQGGGASPSKGKK